MRTKPTALPGKSLGVTLLTAVLLVGTAFADDRIIFIDDFVMDAIVVGYDPVMGNVTLEVAGTVSIPKKRIKQVDYDTTIARTLDDDTAKAVALAELTEEHEEYVVALDVLQGIKERVDAPGDIDVRMARLYEKLGKLSKAIDHLKNFLEKHPGDMEIQAEIDRLISEMRGKGDGAADEPPLIEVIRETVEEGLEEGGWRVEPWGNPGHVSYLSLGKKVDRLLKVDFTKQGKDKVAVRKSLPKEMSDLTEIPTCRFDVYNNTTVPLKLALAVVTSPGWVFYESTMKTIPPRQWEQGVEIDLSAKNFKSEASGWKYDSNIKNLQSTIQIIFLVYDHPDSGVLFFNNIGFR